MSACHTHTSGHQHHHAAEWEDPSAPGVHMGIRGWGREGGGSSVSFIYHGWVLSMFANGLFNNEASFGASIHPGLLLSDVPSAYVNNKRQSGIIRPPDAWGVFLFNHVCVMNAAAVNHCLFIMSPKCSCNGGFNVATALPEVFVRLYVCNWRNWDGVCSYYSGTVALVLVGCCDNVMTRPKVTPDWSSPWDFHIMLSWVWKMNIFSRASAIHNKTLE